MGFRTVTISSRCKLEYSLNYLVYRNSEAEKRILLDEISTLIIQNIGVNLTAALLSECMTRKIKVIFCNQKSNPQGELMPYNASFNTYVKIQTQIGWDASSKESVWTEIVRKKITNQQKNLEYIEKPESSQLASFAEEVTAGDASNREGHAAKVYFHACFGPSFSRDAKTTINAYLDYGYAIVLSTINREIKAFGYLTELGIHHIGATNPFNLSCDIMEPLRPYVDYLVLSKQVNEKNFKERMIAILSDQVYFGGNKMYLDNAIHLYVQSVLICLRDGVLDKLSFIEYDRV